MIRPENFGDDGISRAVLEVRRYLGYVPGYVPHPPISVIFEAIPSTYLPFHTPTPGIN